MKAPTTSPASKIAREWLTALFRQRESVCSPRIEDSYDEHQLREDDSLTDKDDRCYPTISFPSNHSTQLVAVVLHDPIVRKRRAEARHRNSRRHKERTGAPKGPGPRIADSRFEDYGVVVVRMAVVFVPGSVRVRSCAEKVSVPTLVEERTVKVAHPLEALLGSAEMISVLAVPVRLRNT